MLVFNNIPEIFQMPDDENHIEIFEFGLRYFVINELITYF